MCEPIESGHEMTRLAAILWTVGVLTVMVLAGAAGGVTVWLVAR